MVTKTSFRLLNTLTLEHLGPGPEPNITIFWDPKLPEAYKRFCAKISIDTSAIQYESDKEIRSHWGDDAAMHAASPRCAWASRCSSSPPA